MEKIVFDKLVEIGLFKFFLFMGLSEKASEQTVKDLADVLITKYNYCAGRNDRGRKDDDDEWIKDTLLNPAKVYEELDGKICPYDAAIMNNTVKKIRFVIQDMKINSVLAVLKLSTYTKMELARALFIELFKVMDLEQILNKIEQWERKAGSVKNGKRIRQASRKPKPAHR